MNRIYSQETLDQIKSLILSGHKNRDICDMLKLKKKALDNILSRYCIDRVSLGIREGKPIYCDKSFTNPENDIGEEAREKLMRGMWFEDDVTAYTPDPPMTKLPRVPTYMPRVSNC